MSLKSSGKIVLAGLLVTAGTDAIFLSPAFAQPGRYGDCPLGQWMMGGAGMGWIGMIFMILFWVDVSSSATCDAVRKLAEEKVTDVRDKIGTLQRMEMVLAQLVCDCRNRAVTSGCPILAAIEQEASS